MLQQVQKVEQFKKSLNKEHSLHAKFNMSKCIMISFSNETMHMYSNTSFKLK